MATILRQLQHQPDLDRPRLPPALRPVLRRALAKDTGERFSSAAEMRRAIHEARAASVGRPAEAEPEEIVVTPPVEETRPLVPAPVPREAFPGLRVLAGLLAVAALGVHLLSAGGVARATPVFLPEPIGSGDIVLPPSPVAPSTDPSPVKVRVARARPAPSPTPLATPEPPPPDPAVAEPVIVHPPVKLAASIEPGRVYEEDEVDVPPRRIQGRGASYPRWGPELKRGQKASITASFVVTEEGDVTDIKVEKGGGALEAVLVEISRWKFEPGLIDGIPVKVRLRSKHTFIGG